MRILGIDTSLRSTGYGIIESDGRSLRALDCGVIKNKQSFPHSECLRRLSLGIGQLIDEYKPQTIAIEGMFFSKNAKTAMILGMARGSVVAAAAVRDIPIYEYSPTKIKLAVVGTGRASKEQVSGMVGQILSTDTSGMVDDATDALGLAICHFHSLQNPAILAGSKPL